MTDKRQEFFKNFFEKALPFADYIKSGTAQQHERWQSTFDQVQLTNEQQQLITSFRRTLHVLVMSGIWCGDCIRQGPILEKISSANKLIKLKFIDNQTNPDLLEELRIQGGARVPVAVFLSEDFFELTRFGDRTLSSYRRKAMNELGNACDAGIIPQPINEQQQEIGEWLDIFERCQLILRLSPMLRSRYHD